MKYSESDIFRFMEKRVTVTCTDGKTFIGRCWATGSIENEEDFDGPAEASLDVYVESEGCFYSLFSSEIEDIQIID